MSKVINAAGNALVLFAILATISGCGPEIKVVPEVDPDAEFDEEAYNDQNVEYEAAQRAAEESRYISVEAHKDLTPHMALRSPAIDGDNCTVELKFPGIDGATPVGGFGYITGLLSSDDEQKFSGFKLKCLVQSLWVRPKSLTSKYKGAEFLNMAEFPEIRFESTAFTEVAEDGRCKIEGNLTIKGVTRPVSANAQIGQGPGGLTMTSDMKLSLADFGFSSHGNPVETSSDESNEQSSGQLEVSFIIGRHSGPPLE